MSFADLVATSVLLVVCGLVIVIAVAISARN